MAAILIVDDDVNVCNLVGDYLEGEGYKVRKSLNGERALELLNDKYFDLAVVDVMMPGMDGYTLTSIIREQYDIPILLLTAKNRLEDKEKGFLSGTDDYLSKPFEPRELFFRIRALLRRYNRQSIEELNIGDLKINKNSYEVHIHNKTFMLPLKEFELLYFLANHEKQVFSRGHIIEKVWGMEFEGDDRTVDVHIMRLRQRLDSASSSVKINTVRGIGYSLEAAT
ncbi:response regulator transcription factor [Virgibacillus kimchii]